MTRLALAAALAASLALPAFAQPSSGSNNTPAGGGNRMGEAGQVDRRPDITPTTPRQAPPAGGDRSGATVPSQPAANSSATESTGTPGTQTGPRR